VTVRIACLLFIVALSQALPVAAAGRPVRVAAASDLQFVLPRIVEGFGRDRNVQVSYGSSGNFARQIRQGAPFELFLSADEGYVFLLADAGLTRDRGALYAVGRLAFVVPRSSPIEADPRLASFRARMAPGAKFAIANPEHAPYGRAAREALEALDLWQQLLPALVLGENVSQAAQYLASGAAQAGIVALSVAVAPEIARSTRYAAMPEHLHAPLRQRMVLSRNASAAAAELFAYLQGGVAREALRAAGFDPGGQP